MNAPKFIIKSISSGRKIPDENRGQGDDNFINTFASTRHCLLFFSAQNVRDRQHMAEARRRGLEFFFLRVCVCVFEGKVGLAWLGFASANVDRFRLPVCERSPPPGGSAGGWAIQWEERRKHQHRGERACKPGNVFNARAHRLMSSGQMLRDKTRAVYTRGKISPPSSLHPWIDLYCTYQEVRAVFFCTRFSLPLLVRIYSFQCARLCSAAPIMYSHTNTLLCISMLFHGHLRMCWDLVKPTNPLYHIARER